MSTMQNIHWLGHAKPASSTVLGGKAATLNALAKSFQVPDGFCLDVFAFEQWRQSGCGSMPEQIATQLKAAYADLGERSKQHSPQVAVRSSAIGEDGKQASFAGQYDTFLNIIGEKALLEAVRQCWASVYADRVATYTGRLSASGTAPRLAVLVQQLVPADVSAVIFTKSPIDKTQDELIINAAWGLGEALVGGLVNPDVFTVSRKEKNIRSALGQKQVALIQTPKGGTRPVNVPKILQDKPSLSDEQIKIVANLGLRLEQQMGYAVDAEVAFQGQELFLLQCRPITI